MSTAAVGALIGLALYAVAGTDRAGLLVVDIAVAVVSCALVPVTLRWPLGGGLVLGVLAAVSPVATPAATVAALYTARQRRFPAALAVVLAGVAGHAVEGRWRPLGGLSYGWWLLLMVAAYAALLGWGRLAQARAKLVISLCERVRRAEADQRRRVTEARQAERERIAHDMHDLLAHRLSLIATHAGALEYRPDASPERIAAAAGVVRAGVHQALDELRQLVRLLADPGEGDSMPGYADLAVLFDESRQAGMTLRVTGTVTGTPPELTGRTAYRVVQEALTNARKHAPGMPVTVRLDGSAGDRLAVEVRNPMPDGPVPRWPGANLGLVGLAERVRLTGGRIDHDILPGRQFRLHASIPWDAVPWRE